MKRRLSVLLLFFAITISLSRGVEVSTGAALAPADEQAGIQLALPAKSPFINTPGGNAFEGTSASSNQSSSSGSAPSVAVPEPSSVALIGFGVLGLGLLFRRQARD
jgi:hypothetical protein